MKKVFLSLIVIAIVAITAISLVACNNATPQGQLENLLNDHNHEEFSYVVYAKNKATGARLEGYEGTYVVKLDAYDAGSTVQNFGNGELQNVSRGVLVTGLLTVGEGENQTVYKTGCYFNIINGSSYMVPHASYRVQTVGGVEKFRLQADYSDGKNFNYERWIDGAQSSGTVGFKGTCYFDNNEFHQSLRTLSTFSSSMSFSFAMPLVSANEARSVNLTASISETVKIKNDFTANNPAYAEDGIECYKTVISRAGEEVAGMSQTLYYAVSAVSYNGWNLKNILVKIEEPFKLDGEVYEMTYELTTDGAKLS